MSPYTPALQIRLAALTDTLIKACGGLVSAALECDVSKSQLHRAADPHDSYSLKASTIYHLEQACGQPIVSRALYGMATARRCNALSLWGSTCPIAPQITR